VADVSYGAYTIHLSGIPQPPARVIKRELASDEVNHVPPIEIGDLFSGL